MEIKSGNKYPSCALSNFAPHKFILNDVEIASMEGFLQSLKFKNADMQVHICTLVGSKAKSAGSMKHWQTKQILYWQGQEIPRESEEYQSLLNEAYIALFTQCEKAGNALRATKDAALYHSIGRSSKRETVLTRQEFCSRLTKIRKHLLAKTFIGPVTEIGKPAIIKVWC